MNAHLQVARRPSASPRARWDVFGVRSRSAPCARRRWRTGSGARPSPRSEVSTTTARSTRLARPGKRLPSGGFEDARREPFPARATSSGNASLTTRICFGASTNIMTGALEPLEPLRAPPRRSGTTPAPRVHWPECGAYCKIGLTCGYTRASPPRGRARGRRPSAGRWSRRGGSS